MSRGQASSSGGSEPPSSPRPSPPKVVVDDSPLQPAMGKHKESLKVKLMMRRPINELVEQGIMPPLKTPAAYFKQVTQLERAKTGDLLKAKIQRRPDRHELERRHILEQECHLDPSLAEKQRMLKKARLSDSLNDQLSHRPGPLELIKKNILHTEENIETAVKSGFLAFKATSEGASGRPQHPSSYCGPPEEVSPSPSPPAPSTSPAAQYHAPRKDRNRARCKKNKSCKSRFKFHEYKGPPSAQKASSPPESTETPYDLLLQQQQLLLQLMLPASPAASVASVASDSSDALSAQPPPPPPLPPTPVSIASPAGLPGRFEDMKVSDLRAECKRRSLPVSGPKPQLIQRLRFNMEIKEEPPRSPASVASIASPESRAEEQSEDIVVSQSRLIGELKRQLEESRQQLEAARRDAAGASGVQSRAVLQKHLCVTQLQAKLDALHHATAATRYVLASAPLPAPAPQDHYVRLFTVTSPPNGTELTQETSTKAPAYIFNRVKVVPITIVPSAHYEAERAPPAPPPPPPPPLPPVTVQPLQNIAEGTLNEQIEDVLEILAQSGELPPPAVGDIPQNNALDTSYHQEGSSDFTPSDIFGEELLGYSDVGDSLSNENTQRELNDIQNDILSRVEFNELNNRCDGGPIGEIDPELNVDLLVNNEFDANFANHSSPENNDDLFDTLLGSNCDTAAHSVMDIDEDLTDRMSMTPINNGDLHVHTRMGFDDMNDLTLSFHGEDSRQNGYEEDPQFVYRQFDLGMTMDSDHYLDIHRTEPNLFSRGHLPGQYDPVMGAAGAPRHRPVHRH